MNRPTRVSDLYVRNWQLLLFSYFVPVLMLIPFSIAAGRGREGSLFLVLLGMVCLVCATAFYLASVQQEFLSRAFTFLLPGIRRGMLRQHIVAAAALALVAIALVLTLPGFDGLGLPRLGLAWSTACLMATIYGLILLLVFHFPFSSWLPFQATWMVLVAIKLWVRTPPETLGGLLNHPAIWTAAALLTGWLVHNRLTRPALHRRLVEQPFISLADLKSQAKIEQFKQARSRHKNQLDSGRRPGGGLIRHCLENANRSLARGHRSRALVWEAGAVTLATSLPRRRGWLAALCLFLPALVVWLGYFDSHNQARGSGDLKGWFPGFAFMSGYLFVLVFHHLKTRPLGLLRGRGDLHRAGWLGVLLTLATTLAISGVVWLLFAAGHRWLPPVTFFGWDLAFLMPPGYLPFLPLFSLPVQLLVHIRWRMKGSIMVLQQTGTLAFFLCHGLLLSGDGVARWVAVGLAAVSWLALPFVWRWRVFKTDLG